MGLSQEYDGDWHAVYVSPDNALRLIRAILVKIGMENARLSVVTSDFGIGESGLRHRLAKSVLVAQQAGTAEPKCKGATAAERQRRRRPKLKKRDMTVMERSAGYSALPLRLVAAE